MGRDRLERLFGQTRSEGRPAFLPFMTAGLPDPSVSPELFEVMAGAGADGFEVGIPYSDPLMDGPVIQRGSDTAIAAGTTLDVSFEILSQIVARTEKPSLVMTYANPVFRRGVDRFCAMVGEAGADGIIVPDLPVEESQPLRQAAARHGIGVVLFVAPTSDRRRIETVAAADPVFIYAVAEMGVTGERSGSSVHAGDLAGRIREVTDAPIVFGVGISGPDQARRLRGVADGIIVGSALVRLVVEAPNPDAAQASLRHAVAAIRAALSTADSP